ncbi:MAG: type II toxin-antitoxin system VapC family toxin [Spirosomaceae bacterium]|nr:type II toxin-antitoxin system VapC family toxin [Spirosomataceae bacterium]
MAILVDPQIFIWSLISPEKIKIANKDLLRNNTIYVSVISFLEIAIKQKVGKLNELTQTTAELKKQAITDGFQILDLTIEQVSYYDSLPLFSEHRDPFDRILLATSLYEKFKIMSSDANFKLYEEQIELIIN